AHHGQQRIADNRNAPAQLANIHPPKVLTKDGYAARCWPEVAAQEIQQGCLAGAVRPKYHPALPGPDRPTNVPNQKRISTPNCRTPYANDIVHLASLIYAWSK